MMIPTDQAVEKAKEILADKDKVELCWQAKVCPKCGSKIEDRGKGFPKMLFGLISIGYPEDVCHESWECTNLECDYKKEYMFRVP